MTSRREFLAAAPGAVVARDRDAERGEAHLDGEERGFGRRDSYDF